MKKHGVIIVYLMSIAWFTCYGLIIGENKVVNSCITDGRFKTEWLILKEVEIRCSRN